MFKNDKHHLHPHYDPQLLLLFKILGTVIIHSLLQGGSIFPYFVPYAYWYLATKSAEMALLYAQLLTYLLMW